VTSASPERGWRRNQIAVTLAAFVGFTGFTVVMPFLPLYFEQLGVTDPGATATWAGVSLGVTPAVTALMAPFWARVADRRGKKLLVARSLLSFIVIMFALAFVRRPWQVVALRGVHGFFAGYGPVAMTMAAESVPADRATSAIGWIQTTQRLGPAVGPVIGGVLAQAVGLRGAFLVASGVYVVALVVLLAGYREPLWHRQRRSAVPSEEGRWRRLRTRPHFLLFVGAVLGLQLVDRSFGPVLPLYLREIGTTTTQVPFLTGIIFTTMAFAAATGNQVTNWLLRRVGPARVIPGGGVLAAVAATLFGIGAPAAVLLAAAAAFGLGIGVATTAVYSAASAAVSADARNGAFAWLTTAYLTGLALSPVLAGLLGHLSMRAVFVVDAAGLGVLALIVRRRMTPRRAAEEA